jgi:hypothetical protein
MTNITRFIMVAAAAAVVAAPAVSLGATFAYVNQQNEVRTVTADTANIALATAPNIHVHSGVLLLDSPEDNRVLGN